MLMPILRRKMVKVMPKDMLKLISEKNNLSQPQLARRYKVNPSQISRWLTGQAIPNGMTMVEIWEDYKKIA